LNKTEKVRETLLFQIGSGQLKVGDRIPPERVLGELGNVSRVTVRRALETLEQEGFLKKRGRKGIFIDAIPDHGGDVPAGDGAREICYVFFSSLRLLPGGEHTTPARIYNGIKKSAAKRGDTATLMLGSDFLRLGEAGRKAFAGLVVGGTNLRENLPPVLALETPTVLANTIQPGVNVDAVAIDNYEGGYLAASELHQDKRTKLLFLSISYAGEDFMQGSYLRKYRGVKDYCFLHGLPKPKLASVRWREGDAMPTPSGDELEALAGEMEGQRIDGVVCCAESLYWTVDALRAALGTAGFPRVATFTEGGRQMEDKGNISLHADMEHIGFEAAEMLYARMEAPFSDVMRKLIPINMLKKGTVKW